jgi:hypothetical protein
MYGGWNRAVLQLYTGSILNVKILLLLKVLSSKQLQWEVHLAKNR